MANDLPCGGSVMLPGPAGAIEALLECAPAAAGGPAPPVAVICHPHPLYGGNLGNKVVHMLARVLREAAGVHTLRFNFRGVGKSEGRFDHGRGETEDLLAVARWLEARRPSAAASQPWLAGFSFGAYVALRAAAAGALAPARLVTVAPPVNLYPELERLARPPCPWLIVQGEDDEIVPAQAVAAWARRFDPPADLVLVPEAGHFFHRRLGALTEAVRDWLRGEGVEEGQRRRSP